MGTGEGLSVELVKPGGGCEGGRKSTPGDPGAGTNLGFGGVERRLVWAPDGE